MICSSVNLLFFMSVILLKDGLHDLYLGTAGRGQVSAAVCTEARSVAEPGLRCTDHRTDCQGGDDGRSDDLTCAPPKDLTVGDFLNKNTPRSSIRFATYKPVFRYADVHYPGLTKTADRLHLLAGSGIPPIGSRYLSK
jgi:hypothetical protein